jgi:hypothetical protein
MRACPVVGPQIEAGRAAFDNPPAGLTPDLYVVPVHQIDPAGHMNNTAYLDLFDHVLPGLAVDP